MNTFSIGEMITFGWETFKRRPWFFVGAVCLLLVVQFALQMLSAIPVLGFIFSVVAGIFVGMGMIRLFLGAHDSVETASFAVFKNTVGFWRYIGAGILKGAITAGPIFVAGIVAAMSIGALAQASGKPTMGSSSVLLVVIIALLAVAWMLYASARLTFVQYLVLDAGKGPGDAIKESFRATQHVAGKIILFTIVLGLLNILGAIALLVGLLVSIPVSLLAMAHLYRTLCPNAVVSDAPAPANPVTTPPAPGHTPVA